MDPHPDRDAVIRTDEMRAPVAGVPRRTSPLILAPGTLASAWALLYLCLFATGLDQIPLRTGTWEVRPVTLFVLMSIPVAARAATAARSGTLAGLSRLLTTAVAVLALVPFAWAFVGGWPTRSTSTGQALLAGGAVVLGYWLFDRTSIPVRRAATLALAMFLLSMLADVFSPGLLSEVRARAAGFAINPNGAAQTICLLLPLALAWTAERARRDVIVLCITCVAVGLTLSRSGALAWLAIFAFWVAVHVANGSMTAVLLQARPLVPIVVIAALTIGLVHDQIPILERIGRSARLQALTESGPPRSDIRVQLVRDYWDLIKEKPILGHGTGFVRTMKKGPHNVYLARWVEQGLMGILSVLAFLAAAAWTIGRHPPGLAVLGAICLLGLFNHTILADRSAMLLLGVAVFVASQSHNDPTLDRTSDA